MHEFDGGQALKGQLPRRSTRSSTVALTVALLYLFVPLSFSGDFVAAAFEPADRIARWSLPVADAVLFVAVALLMLWATRRSGAWRVRWGWYTIGAAAAVALDLGQALRDRVAILEGVWFTAACLAFYALSLAILAASLVGSWLPIRARRGVPARRFRYVLPLVVGTSAAYLGSTVWDALNSQDLRVNEQYFAQVSQVIPLLLVAVGIEARHFRRYSRQAAGRAATVVTVVTLCVGEALALTTLALPTGEWLGVVAGLYEYLALLISMEACFIALTMLLWVLVTGNTDKNGPEQAPIVEPVPVPEISDVARVARAPVSMSLPTPRMDNGAVVGALVAAVIAACAGVALANGLRRRRNRHGAN